MNAARLLSIAAIFPILNCSQPGSQSNPQPSPAPIRSFSGDYRFLSSFWPVVIEYEGVTYPSVEHAYQSAKTLDTTERRRIAAIVEPGDAKRAGRALPLRADWEQVKLRVMEECVRYKFTQHAELREKLLATGDAELVEGNTWGDRFWGVCDGQGENHLGEILMKIRTELRENESHAEAQSH